ncbi:galactose oxidase [Agrocybe pediades]|nr:galactose oxidase [Agrocybe pediades]
MTTVDDTASFVQTSGDVPSPRLGHTVALLRNVVILWGGDTNRNTSPNHDNSLYLLNLLTREWTLLKVSSPTPRGRYGHTLTLIGSKLYVFGGQVNQEFFNDIWLFDLNSLKTMPTWDNSHEPATSVRPPPRTTHSSVAFEDQIIIFGGTDGKYHYNDTWSFNVNTRVWTELICAGYIPAPRESHAAAVVDGIMYVFGGRGVDSVEIGQLAALNLHTRRWYTFQNMGPEPCPRSGHRMAVVDRLIYILGGDAVNKKPSDDFISAYVLDTKLLKYPNT